MIHCDKHQDDHGPPAPGEVARGLAPQMAPPENAMLPPRLAELGAALFELDYGHGDRRRIARVRSPNEA